MLKLELHPQMIAIIMRALGAQPHDQVRAVVDEIVRQVRPQQASSEIDKANG
jgi:hypothetical protein